MVYEPNWTDQIGQIDTTGVGAGKAADLRNVVANPDLFEPSPGGDNPERRTPDDPEATSYPETDVDPTQHAAANLDTTVSLPGATGDSFPDPVEHIRVGTEVNDGQVNVDTTDPNGAHVPGEVLDPDVDGGAAGKADPEQEAASGVVGKTAADGDSTPDPIGSEPGNEAQPAETPSGTGETVADVEQQEADADAANEDGEGDLTEGDNGDDEKTVEDLTVEQLKDVCRDYEAKGFSTLDKEGLVALVRETVDFDEEGSEAALVEHYQK